MDCDNRNRERYTQLAVFDLQTEATPMRKPTLNVLLPSLAALLSGIAPVSAAEPARPANLL